MKRSSQHIFHAEDQSILYTLHRKRGQKHKYIHIKSREVIITAPYMTSLNSIEELIAEKYNWIIKHISSPEDTNNLLRQGAIIWYLGSQYPVKYQMGKTNRLELRDETAHFILDQSPTPELMQDILQIYYKERVQFCILPRVEHWMGAMGLQPSKVSFRRARTRWGSCSSKNNISLNIYLMMLPKELIDYVVVHELSHIVHKNHSAIFWNLVEQYIPDWRDARRRIHTFESYLI